LFRIVEEKKKKKKVVGIKGVIKEEQQKQPD
jgi:hypothetical protein